MQIIQNFLLYPEIGSVDERKAIARSFGIGIEYGSGALFSDFLLRLSYWI